MTKNYFLNGLTEFIILSFLEKKDCYVYEITKSISEFSDGNLSISQNTIYTATYKLENDGMITEYSKLVGRKRTRVYYHLTPDGAAYLQELKTVYQITVDGINRILQHIASPETQN